MLNPNGFSCVFNFSKLPRKSQGLPGTQRSPAQALRIGCFPIARCGKCCKLGQERDGTQILRMFKQNKMTYQCLSRKSGTTRKSRERLPRDAKIMLLDFGHLSYPENQGLPTQRSPKVVLSKMRGLIKAAFHQNRSIFRARKSILLRGVDPPEILEETHTGIFRNISLTQLN